MKQRYQFCAAAVERIDIEIFDVAFKIIGGGEEGDKTSSVTTKEQADHSLPYVIAVAILDGEVSPAQYDPQRIRRSDVQNLLRRVFVSPNAAYSQRYPEEMPCRVQITLRDGRTLANESRDYAGFVSQPVSWQAVSKKFNGLAERYIADAERNRIVNAIADLENVRIRDLMKLLA